MSKPKAYYAKLGITPEQVAALPAITPQLKLIMAEKKAKSLPDSPYYYLEACGEPAIRKILALKRYNAPLEALCVAAEADPQQVLNAIIAAADRLENYVVGVRMSNAKRDVTDSLITAAKNLLGTDDRKLFMQATGMLPQAKGAQTIIQVTQNASQAAPVLISAPSPEKTIRRLSDRMSQMQLPPPAEDADVFTDQDEQEA